VVIIFCAFSRNADKNVVAFKMARIVCIKRDVNGARSLQWMIIPEITF